MSKFYGKLQKWNERGFSFIERDDGGPNLFAHAYELRGIPADTGCFGVRVEFDVGERPDGRLFAKDVRRT